LKKAELIISGAFIIVALIVIVDSMTSGIGWVPQQGPAAGLVPFYLALIQLFAAGFIFIVNLKKADDGKAFFVGKRGMWEAIRIFGTTTGLTIGIVYLGIYIPTFIFCIVFTKWLGEHKWWSTIAFSIILTLAVFFGMEKGLQIPLPKSFFYEHNMFFF
jgi:hypothetical protein